MTHPSNQRARELLNRLAVKEAAWAAEKASRHPDDPDAQLAWQATKPQPKVRERQVSAEELDARLSQLRDELVSLIEQSVAAFQEELDALADGVGSETGKMQHQIGKLEKALTDIPKGNIKLVKSNDAA